MNYSKPYTFRVEARRDGEWIEVRRNLSMTLAVFQCGKIKERGEPWRAIRSDGKILQPEH